MNYDIAQGDIKGRDTAQVMRDDFEVLHDKIVSDNTDYVLTKSDAARLLIGALIQVNQLQDKIAALRKAIAGYQTEIIPPLQEIVDNATTDEEAEKMGNEKFIIKNNE